MPDSLRQVLYNKNEVVLFPKQGNDELFNQLVYFGSEQYKDYWMHFHLWLVISRKIFRPVPRIWVID